MASAAGTNLKQWKLLGKPVGLRCLATLLGIGNDRMHNASRGHLDMRYRIMGKVPLNHNEVLAPG